MFEEALSCDCSLFSRPTEYLSMDQEALSLDGALSTCQIPILGLRFVGGMVFVPQVDLLVGCRGCLVYFEVEALVSPPHGETRTRTENFFFFNLLCHLSVSPHFTAVLSLLLFSVLFLSLLFCM
jgi:hypothetical protein